MEISVPFSLLFVKPFCLIEYLLISLELPKKLKTGLPKFQLEKYDESILCDKDGAIQKYLRILKIVRLQGWCSGCRRSPCWRGWWVRSPYGTFIYMEIIVPSLSVCVDIE